MNEEIVISQANVAGSVAVCYPSCNLGERFWRYLSAVRAVGAAFNLAERAHFLTDIAQVNPLIDALWREGFRAKVDEVVACAAKARAATAAEAAARAATAKALYPFQREGVAWLSASDSAILGDEMGLGKTVQVLMSLPDVAPVLVVAAQAAKGVWASHTAGWRPEYRPVVLSGRSSFRWPESGEVVITNYDILPQYPFADAAFDTIIVADEAHALKNKKAKRTKRFVAIVDIARAKRGRVWLTTGTPLLNDPSELWNLLSIAGLEKRVFGGWQNFARCYRASKKVVASKTVTLKDGTQKTRLIRTMQWGAPSPVVPGLVSRAILRRTRSEVLPQLPGVTYRTIEVEIGKEGREAADEALRAIWRAGIDIDSADEEALRTIEGACFAEIARARAALATAKLAGVFEFLAMDDVQSSGDPIIGFSAHVAPVRGLAGLPGWAQITGNTPAEERSAIAAGFQRGEYKGLAATIIAAGVAITLTRAWHVFFVDREWTPALNDQAIGRACRIGQTRGVLVTNFVADHHLDRRVNEILTAKQEMISATFGK